MRERRFSYPASVVLLGLTVLMLCVSSAAAATGERCAVQVRAAKIRAEPKHWSAPLGELKYGDSLEEISKEGAWLKVRSGSGTEGYIHESAITRRAVVLRADAGNVNLNVDAADIVLAGKGFCEEVELSYRENNPQVDFETLKTWESRSVDDQSLTRFLEEGQLNVR